MAVCARTYVQTYMGASDIAMDDKNPYNSNPSCTIMKKKNQELLIKVGAIFVVLLFVGTAVTAMVFS